MINPLHRNMWPALRVRAPALQTSAELSWVLVRAFAPLDAVAPEAIDGSKVLALAEKLDLAPRIATLHAQTLFEQLGAGPAREMTAQRLRAVAVDRVLTAVTDELLNAAKELAVPIVLLKHAALRRRGFVNAGERNARDVDLLAPPVHAGRLQARLIERGFASAAYAPVHHLPTLTRRGGEVVEIHHALWGMRVAGGLEDPDAESLVAAGLTEELADGSQTPSPTLMAAHAIVHGLIQHRSSPEGYPSMRAITDVCAINLHGADADVRCGALLRNTADCSLMRAAMGLARSLAAGVPSNGLGGEEHALLSHVVAASTNPLYRRALRFERLLQGGILREAPRILWRAVPSSRARQPRSALLSEPMSRAADLFDDARSYVAFKLRREG